MDQYMDSYGDNITIGCLGRIAYYRLRIFLFSPCGNEVKMCVYVCVCACVCVRGGGRCVFAQALMCMCTCL